MPAPLDLRRGQVVGDASRRAVNLNTVTKAVASATYAPLASPVFTGDPHAPTPAPGDNDTSLATTAFVHAAVAAAAGITQLTGDATAGPGSGPQALTLATVLASPGTYNNLTVNGKGLVTAGSNAAYVTGGPYLALSGGSVTGNVGIGGTALANVRLLAMAPGGAGNAIAQVAGGVTGSDTATYLVYFTDQANTTQVGAITRNGTASVLYTTTSDQRLKAGITDSETGLEAVMRLGVREFTYEGEDRPQHGFVAQEVAKIYPIAVRVGGDDPAMEPWGIDYGRLTPLLARAIQQQQALIDGLKSRLVVLEEAGR